MSGQPVTTYKSFREFDEAAGFSSKLPFTLAPLQIQDIEQFVLWDKSLNRYEVGGGKTVVSTIVSLMRCEDITIVTVPPILIRPWVRWLNSVSQDVVEYQGRDRNKRLASAKAVRWIVCSHAIFRQNFHIFEHIGTRTQRLGLIVDEAHWLKNVESQLYKKSVQLTYGAERFMQMLTGTPTSKPLDYYAYIKIISPHIYRTYEHFENLHVATRDQYRTPKTFKNLDMLSKNFEHHNILRTKEQIHGYNIKPLYPDCSYVLSDKHQALYERLVDEQLLLLPDGMKIDASTAQKLYHAMQQIVVNFSHFSGNPEDRSAAYDLLDLTVEQTECNTKGKSKLIVWTLYKMTSRSVWKYLEGLGIKTVAAYSETKSQDSFDQFMDDDDTRVLVAQYQSAGAGLNPQGVCWETLHLETSRTPLHAVQSFGRVDRMGQKHVPTIRVGVAENTIQTALFHQLLHNDDILSSIEGDRKKLRDLLLGRV